MPSWLADSGGKGIQIITVAHGEAQLRSRWGVNGARVIMDTSGTKIWLPGISDPATLDASAAPPPLRKPAIASAPAMAAPGTSTPATRS